MTFTKERILIYGAVAAIALIALVAWLEVKRPGPAVPPADTTLGQYQDRPTAAAPPPSGAGTTVVAPVHGCALRFSFPAPASAVAAGAAITRDARIGNAGDTACQNASFSAYWAGGETFVSATPAPTADGYYWNVGTLLPGQYINITIHTTAGNDPSSVTDACATADNGEDACASEAVYTAPSATAAAPAPVASLAVPAGKEFGTWVWVAPDAMGAGYAQAALASAAANHFNAVYVTIDDYLEIQALAEGPAKAARTQAYMNAVAQFVTLARVKGITVDAEGGARDWGSPGNRSNGYALIAFVAQYNQAHPEAKLRGLQYDVESYLLPQYDSDQAGVLSDYVAFIDESAKLAKSSGIAFSVVVPHFYDDVQGWTPSFTYNGKDAYAYTHLLDVLAQAPGSTVIVMAYRNFLTGPNSTEALAHAELTEAAGTPTRVIVAQEMGNVSPDYVTFYGFSKTQVLGSLTQLFSDSASFSSFAGVSVHYLDPFLALK